MTSVVLHTFDNALKSFETRRMQFGEHTFQLDQPGMKHILQRHHPEFWDGSIKDKQTFLDPKMSVQEVARHCAQRASAVGALFLRAM